MSTAWERAYQAGRAEYGPLPLAPEAFEARAREVLARRLGRQGRGAGEVSLTALLGRSAERDLYLVAGLEGHGPEARAVCATRAAPGLEAFARAQGLDEAAAREAVRSLLDEVVTPAAADDPRTPLSAYDGTASLTTWLSVRLARRMAAAGGPAGPDARCVPENLLAGLAEDRLDGREPEALGAHLAGCTACRATLDALARGGLAVRGALGGPSSAAPRAGPGPLLPDTLPRLAPVGGGGRWKVAGWLLGLAGGIVAVSMASGGRRLWDSEARRQDSEYEVIHAAQDLVRREPGIFGDFEPYDRDLLESAPAAAPWSGFAAVYPRGKVLLRTPPFRWSASAGNGRYRVRLLSEGGEELWARTVEGTSMAWPSEATALLREMAYAWTVAPEGGAGPEARAAFHVEAEREVVRWETRRSRLAKSVGDEGARRVLAAEIALRKGYVLEAWTSLEEHLASQPKDAYALALRGYIERLHGFRP